MSNPSVQTDRPATLVIASRQSRLALWQSEHVKARLESLYPGCRVRIESMTTRGDQILDRPLAQVGGKGLFIKELEVALLDGRCDLAVHSLKDVPMELGAEFALAAVLAREDPHDAFVSPHYAELAAMPHGAVLGTSSLRRAAQVRARFPSLRVVPLRGNVDTRLAKLDAGAHDAIILAAAGLMRLGLSARIRSLIPTDISLPAPGQGALGLEVCSARSDLLRWLAPLHDAPSAACVYAERAVSQGLGGSCTMPLAAYATLLDAHTLHLTALVANEVGTRMVHSERQGRAHDAAALGAAVAADLVTQGALELIAGT